MADTTYNGWTNYATWRINLEMIDGSDWHTRIDDECEAYELAPMLQDWAVNWIEESSDEGFVRDYALAFLDNVNWHEIAQHLIADYAEEVTE